MLVWVKLRIDGQPWYVNVQDATRHLSGLLRSFGKLGPRLECGTGRCGGCIVIVDDRPVKSCTVPTENCGGTDVWTADHLDSGPSLHPMLAAFRHHGVPACEVCMPGMLLAAIAYATRDRELTEAEIDQDLVAEMCRCKFSGNIVAAVFAGARVMHKLRPLGSL